MLSRDDVETAFQMVLGRLPESEASYAAHQCEETVESLLRRLIAAPEFRVRVASLAAVGSSAKWVCTEIGDGLKLWVDLADIGVSAGCLLGNWEPAITTFIIDALEPGDTFIDVGANVGWFSILAAARVGSKGQVWAFEPRPETCGRLRDSVRLNCFEDRCIVEQVALGAVEGRAELAWIPQEKNPGHSFLTQSDMPEGAATLGNARVKALDSYAFEHRVRVIKIDVEGAELQVLEGASGILGRDKPILVMEVFPHWLDVVGGTTALILIERLRTTGYRVFRMTDVGLGMELMPDEDGVRFSEAEYFSIVALSSEDASRFLAERFDRRATDLEERLVTETDNRMSAEQREQSLREVDKLRELELEGLRTALSAHDEQAESLRQSLDYANTTVASLSATLSAEGASALSARAEAERNAATERDHQSCLMRELTSALARLEANELDLTAAVAARQNELERVFALEQRTTQLLDKVLNTEFRLKKSELRATEALSAKRATEASLLYEQRNTSQLQDELRTIEAQLQTTATTLATTVLSQQRTEEDKSIAVGNVAALMNNVSAVTAQLQRIENSTTWKMTYPVRRFGELLPRPIKIATRRTAQAIWWLVTLQIGRRVWAYRKHVRGGADQAIAFTQSIKSNLSSIEARGVCDEDELSFTRCPEQAEDAGGDSNRAFTQAPSPDRSAEEAPSLQSISEARGFWGSSFVVPPSLRTGGDCVLPCPSVPRVLIIDSRWPRPDRDSGSLDAVHQVRALQRLGYEVVFTADAEFAEGFNHRDKLSEEGVTCLSAETCLSIERFLQTDGATLALCILSRVHSGGRYLETVIRHAPSARVIFNTVDLHHQREEREARLAQDKTALHRASGTRERELYLVRQADATIVVSSTERELLNRLVPGARVVEFPLSRAIRSWNGIPGFDRRGGIGFVGGFDHKPNVDAAEYLIDEIWPRVEQSLPGAQLSLVGDLLPNSLLNRLPRGVRYLGTLPGLEPWFDSLRLTVAPLRYGAGAKGKVASSMASGVPCVGTPVAAEGMGLRHGTEMLVGSEPGKLSELICAVHEDAALWARVARASHAKAQIEFSLEAGEGRLAEMLNVLDLPHKRIA